MEDSKRAFSDHKEYALSFGIFYWVMFFYFVFFEKETIPCFFLPGIVFFIIAYFLPSIPKGDKKNWRNVWFLNLFLYIGGFFFMRLWPKILALF